MERRRHPASPLRISCTLKFLPACCRTTAGLWWITGGAPSDAGTDVDRDGLTRERKQTGRIVADRNGGLLIVNADDWGYDVPTSDAILKRFRDGAISSTTGMVFMDDSERAAEIARSEGLPVGLHLNLTQVYTGSGVPDDARERQARLAAKLSGSKLHRWVYDPLMRRDIQTTVREQFDEFAKLYGCAPTHLDGHHHIHVIPNVLFSGAVPPRGKLRSPVCTSWRSAAARARGRLLRSALRQARFTTTDYLLSIDELDAWAHDDGAIALPRSASVEVMTHPGVPEEDSLLESSTWRRVLASRRLGSFKDLY
jgi:predicted glycoside hydrolase/deacetylase ChbG (UPF0249 family)